MNEAESLECVEKVLHDLIDMNKEIPVLVEGEKDLKALRELGLVGEIIIVQSGKKISALCDFIAENYREIIILTDWDRKGWQLYRRIERNLRGRTRCIHYYRDTFAKHLSVKNVEGVPAFIKTLTEKLNGGRNAKTKRYEPRNRRSYF